MMSIPILLHGAYSGGLGSKTVLSILPGYGYIVILSYEFSVNHDCIYTSAIGLSNRYMCTVRDDFAWIYIYILGASRKLKFVG
jgi:hypothetical protein